MSRGTLLFVLLGVLVAPAAWAGSPSSRLVYARGPGADACPDEDAFRKEVASRLGYDPFFPYASRTVSVEIEFVGGKGRARVVFVDDKGFEQGAQTIEGGPACEPLVSSAALAISVSLEALAPAEPAPPPEEKKAVAAPPPVEVAPAPVEIVRPRTAPRREAPPPRAIARRRPALSLSPQIWAGFGQWPVATFGVGAAVELRAPAFGVALEGRWDAPATLTFGASGDSAEVQRATGSLVPCAHWSVLSFCGVATLGESWASGIDVTNPRTASAFYAAFGGRIGLDVPLGSRFRWSFLAQAAGIATPMHILVGADRFDSGPVDVTVGSSLAMSIF